MRRHQALFALTIAIATVLGPAMPCAGDPLDVPTITVSELTRLIEVGPVLMFDTREKAEFDVSHIEGAHWLDPAVDDDVFVANLGSRARGKHIVFYCSIGPRATAYALNAAPALIAAGAVDVRVLEDGLIAWANAGRPMIDNRGPTSFVHPGDAASVSHLRDPSRARFEAQR